MSSSPWWLCSSCGFANQPRHAANSLGFVGAAEAVMDPEWRSSHCEQCGKERDGADVEYQPHA